MKLKSLTSAGRAGDLAYLFRGRGWHIVPTRPIISQHLNGIGAAHHSPIRADDITFAQWFGPRGTYRKARNIGVFTGQVSGGLYVFEINMNDPEAVATWEKTIAGHEPKINPEFTSYTEDNHYRLFIKIVGPSRPPSGMVYPGITIFGDGDFVSIPTLTLEDIKREGGVH